MDAMHDEKEYDNESGVESRLGRALNILENVVGQCHESGVNFYETLFFVLKADYLRQVDMEIAGGSEENPSGQRCFTPDSEEYHRILHMYLIYSVLNTGMEKNDFDLLVHEMAENYLYNYSIESQKVVDLFQTRFEKKHERWIMLQDELGDRTLYLEKIRLHNASINFKFMETFGKEYVPMVEQEARLDILSRKKALLEMYPDISSSDLDEKLREHLEEKEKHLKALEAEAAFAGRGEIYPDKSLQALSYEQDKQYRQESKKILREIFLLIHPDVLRQNPEYNKLSDCQRTSLNNIWHEVMALREEEIGFASTCRGHELRSVVTLMDKLDLVRSIINNAGLDTDPRFVIQGKTLYERLGWIERSIRSIEVAISSLEAEQKVLYEDDVVSERKTQISWPESMKDELKKYYLKKNNEYESEADEIEAFINNYFNQAA